MQDSTFYFRFFFLILMPESFDKHFKLLHFKKKNYILNFVKYLSNLHINNDRLTFP